MSSEEEDYMTMDFTVTSQNDVRPGLLQTAKQKRELDLLKRKQEFDTKFRTNKKKNLKVLEEEHREEGLRKPIEEDNRGFALLAKMGYKPGGGIGKTAEKQSNPTALIDITVKTSRKGLGLAERKPRIRSTNVNRNKSTVSSELSSSQLNAFRSALAAKHGERKLLADLSRSQKVCASLEQAAGWSKPLKWWYWPVSEIQANDEEQESLDGEESELDRNETCKHPKNKGRGDVDDEDNDFNRLSDTNETGSKTKSINSLPDECDRPYDNDAEISNNTSSSNKSKRDYFKDESKDKQAIICDNVSERKDNFSEENCEDVKKDCGDLRKEDNFNGVQDQRGLEEEMESDEEDYEDNLSTAEKLEVLTRYLRSTYMYCIWCGTRYTDESDLTDNSPGDTSDDH